MDMIAVKLALHTTAYGMTNVHHQALSHAIIGTTTLQTAGQLAAHSASLAKEIQLNAIHENKKLADGDAHRPNIV